MSSLSLNETTIEAILRLGIVTMFSAGQADNKMRDVIESVLYSNNETLISDIRIASGEQKLSKADIIASLRLLLAFIKEQAPETSPRYWMTGMIAIGITLIFVALRFAIKWLVLRAIKRDDWLIFIAWLAGFAWILISFYDEKHGSGCRHIWDLSIRGFKRNLLTLYILELVYAFVSLVVKLCIMGFYWDLFPYGEPRFCFFHRYIVIGSAALVIILGIGEMTAIFQCRPINFWDDPLRAKCLPRGPIWVGVGVFTGLADLFILFIPIRMVWMLELKRREKATVTALFCLGALSCAADIPRMFFINNFVGHPDITFVRCRTNLWIVLQFCLAIVAICIPAFKYFLTRYLPGLFVSSVVEPEQSIRRDTWASTAATATSSPRHSKMLASCENSEGNERESV